MFVGITTAPRRIHTLQHTVDCVKKCGYIPIVFAEPRSQQTDVPTLMSDKRLGIWKNWLRLANYALERGEEKIVSLQDDIDIHPDTLSFVEEVTIPGILSLYTARHYGRGLPPGIHHIHTRYLWGACALAFTAETLKTILDHPRAASWDKEHGQDIVISNIVHDLRIPIHFISPSPVAHVAKVSSVGHGSNEGNRNCAVQADPNIPLKEQIQWPN